MIFDKRILPLLQIVYWKYLENLKVNYMMNFYFKQNMMCGMCGGWRGLTTFDIFLWNYLHGEFATIVKTIFKYEYTLPKYFIQNLSLELGEHCLMLRSEIE